MDAAPEVPSLFTDVVVANLTDSPKTVRIRPLKDGVDTVCSSLSTPFADYLGAELFAPATTWIIEPGQVVPIRENLSGGSKQTCFAFLLDGPELPQTLVVWWGSRIQPRELPHTAATLPPGRAVEIRDVDGQVTWAGPDLVFGPPSSLGPATNACGGLDGEGLAWSALPPADVWRTLTALDMAPDGCWRFQLDSQLSQVAWFLCVPGVVPPFEVGDSVSVRPLEAVDSTSAVDGVEVFSDHFRLLAGRGTGLVPLVGLAGEQPVSAPCPAYRDSCGGHVQPMDIRLQNALTTRAGTGASEQALVLSAGDTIEVPGAEGVLTLVTSQLRSSVDTGCFPAAGAGLFVESVLVGPLPPAGGMP